MLKSVLQDFPNTDIGVSIVWIDMLGGDNESAARESALLIKDARAAHFHDPRPLRLAGKAFAEGLLKGGSGHAWDIYMFYDKGVEWKVKPPQPVEWMHQLGGGQRADAARFHSGQDLIDKLHEAMHQVSGEECVTGK